MDIKGVQTVVVALLVVMTAVGMAVAQEGLVARTDPCGLIHVMRGEAEVARIELSGHGPGWQHAGQKTAVAEVTELPDGALRFAGRLPVPSTSEGASLSFTQTVSELPQGLRIVYDIGVNGPMQLAGLQASVHLPVALYAGKEAIVSQPYAEPTILALPVEPSAAGAHQLWNGDGARVESAAGTADAVSIQLRAPTNVVIQDLRQWEQPVYEVRLPAIMQDPGRQMTADDHFHLDLVVAFAEPVELRAPQGPPAQR